MLPVDRNISQTKKSSERKNDIPRVTPCEFILLILLTIATCYIKVILGKVYFALDI